MKIDNTNINSLSSGEVRQQQRAASVARTEYERTASSGRTASAPGDQIELSGLSKAVASLSSESPDRTRHVERLAAAYAEGSYRVEAEEVSRRIVEDAQRP